MQSANKMCVALLFGGMSSEHEVSCVSVGNFVRNIDRSKYEVLTVIIQNYGGGPVGLETLAATIGEEAVTLEDVYEPYLMQLGFLTRTPRGRCVTALAYDHLHIPYEGQSQFSI